MAYEINNELNYNQISRLERSCIPSKELQISDLENLPQSLQELYIRDNQISKLENIPSEAEIGKLNKQLKKLDDAAGVYFHQVSNLLGGGTSLRSWINRFRAKRFLSNPQ